MAEQNNFYAVQRGAPWSFRPVSDGVINWYLYNFGSNLGVAFVERPSNLWVEMPWNCIFRGKNIVFSSASGGRSPPEPPSMGALYLHFRIFFLPLCPSLLLKSWLSGLIPPVVNRFLSNPNFSFCSLTMLIDFSAIQGTQKPWGCHESIKLHIKAYWDL